MDSGDILNNLRTIIFLALMGLFILLLALLAMLLLPFIRNKIKEIILKQRDAWMYNNLISAITLTYLT